MTKNIDKFMVCVMSGSCLTVLERLFGTYDKSLGFLLLMMMLDFITGIMCGAKEHKLSSEICVNGLFKKLFVLVYVIIGHHLDVLLGVTYIRTAICYMYATSEIISMIENGTRLGLSVPEPIKKALDILNGGKEDD